MSKDNIFSIFSRIKSILDSADNRVIKVERIAEEIRLTGDYRWVGIYDVDEREISIIAWSGRSSPTFPRFPVSQGLNGAAVSSQSTVVANDVANDPRYLTTFGSTQSEIVVPVINRATGTVIGTIDVESMKKNAFTDNDKIFLEECSRVITRLWG